MRRDDICIFVSPADRARLEAIVADGNRASKHVWRAKIVLATADGLGTNAIMRRTGKSKPCVWRWQERYIAAGVDGLLRDKTRPARKKPLSAEVKLQVLTMTMQPPPTIAKYLDLHSIVDNYGTHKTKQVQAWLAKHPRFKLHFIPTSSSWLNLVERFFAEITGKKIRRGACKSVADLIAAIEDYLSKHNTDPKPFVWTKPADAIPAKTRRARVKVDAAKNGYQALVSEH